MPCRRCGRWCAAEGVRGCPRCCGGCRVAVAAWICSHGAAERCCWLLLVPGGCCQVAGWGFSRSRLPDLCCALSCADLLELEAWCYRGATRPWLQGRGSGCCVLLLLLVRCCLGAAAGGWPGPWLEEELRLWWKDFGLWEMMAVGLPSAGRRRRRARGDLGLGLRKEEGGEGRLCIGEGFRW